MSTLPPPVQALFAAGQATWPGVVAQPATFAQVVARWQQRTGHEVASGNGKDLYIAAALWDGDGAAAARFDATYLQPLCATLAHKTGLPPAAIADVLQIVREKLLVSRDDGPAKIIDMVGDGRLEALLRVVATRTALNFRRDQKLDVSKHEDEAILDRIAADGTPAESAAQREAQALVRAALGTALTALSDRDRTLLRLHFFHRMSIDAIGQIYEVHRATAARWLVGVCESLGNVARADLKDRMHTRADHMDSLLGMLETGLSTGFWQAQQLGPDEKSPAKR